MAFKIKKCGYYSEFSELQGNTYVTTIYFEIDNHDLVSFSATYNSLGNFVIDWDSYYAVNSESEPLNLLSKPIDWMQRYELYQEYFEEFEMFARKGSLLKQLKNIVSTGEIKDAYTPKVYKNNKTANRYRFNKERDMRTNRSDDE